MADQVHDAGIGDPLRGPGPMSAARPCCFMRWIFRCRPVNAAALLVACLLIVRTLVPGRTFRRGRLSVARGPAQFLHRPACSPESTLIICRRVRAGGHVPGRGCQVSRSRRSSCSWRLVLLAMLLLSDRVRLHTSRFVSRHFQRPIYDYRTVWRRFTEATAACPRRRNSPQATVKLL